MFFSNGSLLSNEGELQNTLVSAGYGPLATDVRINGTLHDIDGRMYTTVDANQGATDVLINGIRHTNQGVRYFDQVGPFLPYPEGFSVTDSDGRQSAVGGNQIHFVHGITVNGAGGIGVSDLPGGPGVNNWQLEGSTDAWGTESGGVWRTEA
jgi:hypothetical protein